MRLINLLMSVPPKLPKSFSNLPERYIKKQTEFIEWLPPKMKSFNRYPLRYRQRPYYDVHRPWEREFKEQNAPGVDQPRIYVRPFRRFPILRGDRVEILVGRDAGKQGIVDYIVEERNWIFVEGLNLKYDLIKQDRNFPGAIKAETMPLLYPEEVLLVDPTDNRPTEGEWRYDEDGNDIRISTRTAREIPIPADTYQTYDYKLKDKYVEEKKDTPAKFVEEVTYKAEAKTFEMDIMEKQGIKEDRVPYPFFWY